MHKQFLVVLAVLLVPLVLFAGPSRTAVQPFSDGKTDRMTATGGMASLSKAPASPDATSAALATAADWLLARQAVSGGFPWSLEDPVLYGNVQGPAGRGVLKAYQYTGNMVYRTAALSNGNFLVPNPPQTYTDGDPRFATYDPLFLEELSAETGVSDYSTFVQSNFWDKLNGGTYGETNDLDAAEFCDLVITGRASMNELVPWDLAGVAVGAHVAGENGIAAAVMSKILQSLNNTTEADNVYDLIGLTGAVWASAVTGIDLDPTAGIYATDNSTAALAARLAALQQTEGAWMWSAQNPDCDSTDQTNFDTQVTAFAVLALKAHNATTYHEQIYKGAGFLLSMQQTDGQMLIYPTAAPTAGGGVETHAEALTAIVTARPDDIFVDDSWASATPGLEVATGKFFGFNAFATIQEGLSAVMASKSVNVAAGVYAEHVSIAKAISLLGSGSSTTTIDGTLTGNCITLSADNVTIDGFALINGYNGVAGETDHSKIQRCAIYDNQTIARNSGVGISLWGDNDNNTIASNTIYNNDRQGIFIGYEDATKLSTGNRILNNTVHDNGLYRSTNADDQSEYGIQLWNADQNLIQGNTVYNHHDWVASAGYFGGMGIYLTYSAQNTVCGNSVFANNINIGAYGGGTHSSRGNIIQGNTLVDPVWWSVDFFSDAASNHVNFNVFGPADPGKYIRNSSTTVSLDAQFNWFGGETAFGAGDFAGLVNTNGAYATDPTVAIFPVTHYMPQNSTVNISVMALIPSGTTVKGTDINLTWDNDAAIPDEGDPLEGPFFASAGPTFYEFTNPTESSLRVNQSFLGTGGVSGGTLPYVNVLFTQAFKSGPADGINHILLSSVQMRDPANAPITVNLDPDPTPRATLIVDGTPPSVSVAIDNQTNVWTDAWLKNGDQIAVTSTITDAYPLTASDITANLGGLFGGIDHTADHPASYVAPLASWPVVASASCNPANGIITVTVTATDALGNVGTGSATITADNTAPTALTNFRANAGHNKVNLTWDDPSGGDPTYRGVLVRYAKWTGYPDYVGAGPAFPANETAGDGQAVLVTGAVFAASHTFVSVERGIYYYRGFVVDQAGNYSLANGSGNDADRSTNYILGDLGSGPGIIGDSEYDGSVDFDDLSLFSLLYFEPDANPPGWPYPAAKEADFGPTSNNKTHGIGSSFGIPDNDGAVEFEDLMIFSMNYNYTAPPKISVPPGYARASAFALSMVPQSSSASEYVVTLRIDNDGRPVKGASAELRFDPKVLQVSGVARGDLLGAEGQSFHGHRTGEGMLRVDCALLGKGLAVEHSGNLATVHFRVLSQGDPALRLAGATVRNAVNGEVAVELTETVAELPTTFDLAQNYPNPFNPATTIKYQVPSPVNVEVTVFNILGEKITTLVNEVQAAGFYTLEWNGRDSRNLAVPTGLYFYTMRAGDFSSVKKMMLMK